LSQATGPADAARAAKRLVGSYAHMKPGDPVIFMENIAAVLSTYPLDVVRECVDPRYGIARRLKFLSIQELVEWLDAKLEYYRLVAATNPHPPALPAPTRGPDAEMAKRVQGMLRDLAARIRTRAARGDVIARRRRVAQYLGERQLRRDRARALAEIQPALEQDTAGATEGLG